MQYDPFHPYAVPERRLEPPDETEACYQDTWTVRLYEKPLGGGQRLEIDAWTFTDEQAAFLHSQQVLADPDLDEDEYHYSTIIEEGQIETDPPEPDWDSMPGGHDDY